MMNIQQFLYAHFPEEMTNHLYSEMKELSLLTAEALSKSSDGLLGELGVDLALDQNNKIWLLEVNSKPSKNFQGTYSKFRPSVKYIVQYAEALFKERLTSQEKGDSL